MSFWRIFTGRHARHIEASLLVAALLLNGVGVLSLQAALSSRALERVQRRGLDIADVEQLRTAPARLIIPSINVEAPVVQVGLREDGLMDIPPTPHEVGWFALGFLPGEKGNAVMAGHLDQASGEAAVFWELRRLRTGDVITVTRVDGTPLRYIVESSAHYTAHNAPLQRLFGASTGSYLHLVTCNGAWQEDLQTYDKRLVVTAKLEQ